MKLKKELRAVKEINEQVNDAELILFVDFFIILFVIVELQFK